MGIAIACRCQRNDQHPPRDLGARQPVRRRLRRLEERIIGPEVVDVVQPQVGMLEQVCGLRVDLERVFVEKIEIEAVSHCRIV